MAGTEHASPLASLVVTIQSPDQSISATLSHGGRLELRIHPMAYRQYREETLDSLLTNLLTDVWAEYRRRYFEFVSRSVGVRIGANDRDGGAAAREFRRDWQALPVSGSSATQRVEVRSEGLTRWRVRIRPGTLRSLGQDDFLTEFEEAFQALMNDYHEKLTLLKDRHFDLRLDH